MLTYLKKRLEERSTWCGLGAASTAALTTLANTSAPHALVQFLTYGIAASGIIAVMVPSQSDANG